LPSPLHSGARFRAPVSPEADGRNSHGYRRFEAAAWYGHFVDVVWLFLFAAIYIWGSSGGAGGH
jgi:hypothetical protein